MLIPSRKMYSLAEAAALVGCSIEDLLLNEKLNKFKIFVSVPDELQVYSTNQSLLDLVDPAARWMSREVAKANVSSDLMQPISTNEVNLLALAPGDCKSIASYGTTNQDRFKQGAFAENGNDLLIVEPAPIGSLGISSHLIFRMFVCYVSRPSSEQLLTHLPKKIKITVDMLRVRRVDLELSGLFHNIMALNVIFDNGFRQEPYMSSKLISLNEGALHFWNCTRTPWSKPKNTDVENWFVDKHKFSKKLAVSAARILRQSYENWNQDKYDKRRAEFTNKIGPVANMFDAVVVVAESWKNADLGQGTRKDQLDTYPKRQEKIEWLLKQDGFAENTADHAWTIAVPDNAKPIGRPRNSDE